MCNNMTGWVHSHALNTYIHVVRLHVYTAMHVHNTCTCTYNYLCCIGSISDSCHSNCTQTVHCTCAHTNRCSQQMNTYWSTVHCGWEEEGVCLWVEFTSAQPGAGQDDYNPFTDEGVKEKEPEV